MFLNTVECSVKGTQHSTPQAITALNKSWGMGSENMQMQCRSDIRTEIINESDRGVSHLKYLAPIA